jgi:hypothetical protein
VKVTYQLRVTAEDNIHQSTAIVLAQGYLEQLCRLPYNTPNAGPYNQFTNPPGLVQIYNGASAKLTDNSGNAMDIFQNGAYGPVTINLDQDSVGNGTYPMQFSITKLQLTDLSVATGGNAAHTTTGSADGMGIEIDFTESYVLAGATRTFKSSVRTVYANVATQ